MIHKGFYQGEVTREHLQRRRRIKDQHEVHEEILDHYREMETHADLEGSNTHIDPLGSGNDEQAKVPHEHIKFIEARKIAWH